MCDSVSWLPLSAALRCVAMLEFATLRSWLDCEWFCKAGPTNPTSAQRGLELGPGRCEHWHKMRSTYSDQTQTLNFYKVTSTLPSLQQSIKKCGNNLAVEISWDRLSLVRSRSHISIPTCLRLGFQESTAGWRVQNRFLMFHPKMRWNEGGVPDFVAANCSAAWLVRCS